MRTVYALRKTYRIIWSICYRYTTETDAVFIYLFRSLKCFGCSGDICTSISPVIFIKIIDRNRWHTEEGEAGELTPSPLTSGNLPTTGIHAKYVVVLKELFSPEVIKFKRVVYDFVFMGETPLILNINIAHFLCVFFLSFAFSFSISLSLNLPLTLHVSAFLLPSANVLFGKLVACQWLN